MSDFQSENESSSLSTRSKIHLKISNYLISEGKLTNSCHNDLVVDSVEDLRQYIAGNFLEKKNYMPEVIDYYNRTKSRFINLIFYSRWAGPKHWREYEIHNFIGPVAK